RGADAGGRRGADDRPPRPHEPLQPHRHGDARPRRRRARGVRLGLAQDAAARSRSGHAGQIGAWSLATRPYPRELEQTADLNGLQVLLRPIRPEDAPAYAELVERSGAEDLRMRFFTLVRRLPPRELARYTRIDYDRDMAFVAVSPQANGEILGEIRLYTYPDGDTAEFAILVRTDMQRRGLGRALLAKAMDYLRARGTATLIGQIRDDNEPMLALARRCGMEIELPPGGTLAIAHLDLRTAAEQARAPRRYDATPGAHTTMTALTKDHRDRLAAQLAERKQVLLGEIR